LKYYLTNPSKPHFHKYRQVLLARSFICGTIDINTVLARSLDFRRGSKVSFQVMWFEFGAIIKVLEVHAGKVIAEY